MNQIRTLYYFILLLASFSAVAIESDAESSKANAARESIIALAEEGTAEAYEALNFMLTDPEASRDLFEGESGNTRGARSIRDAIERVGNHKSERSYQFLMKLIKTEFEQKRVEKCTAVPLFNNLLKYREDKGEELIKFIKGRLFLTQEQNTNLLEEYPFLKKEGIFFSYSPESWLNYVDANGKIIHKNDIPINQSNLKSNTLLHGLYIIGGEDAYRTMTRYFSTWYGRQGELIAYTEVYLKEKRYDPLVIDMYEALLRDERHHPDTRASFVSDFFNNIPSHMYGGYIENPEEHFPQVKEASEEALLKMLNFADYAITLPFLPQKTLDLVYLKRAEIIDRLVAMGHNKNLLNEAMEKKEIPKRIEADPVPKMAPESDFKKPDKANIGKSPQNKSNHSNKWLWLLSALILSCSLAVLIKNRP